jgi:signal peptidase I
MIRSNRQQILIILILSVGGLMFLGLLVFLRLFLFEARYIPSGSMEPTLQVNDRVLINKTAYFFSAPKRGEIVLFNPPETLLDLGASGAFIGRLIGMPGDRIEVRNQRLLVNGNALKESYVADGSQNFSVEACYFDGTTPFLATPQTIPAGHYLTLGDNRDNSFDGRCWGLVPQGKIMGKATTVFYPFNRYGDIPLPSYLSAL